MTWEALEAGAPEIAAFGRQRFEQSAVAVIGTIRRDGSARVSCVQACVLNNFLYLGMMWRSRKALDLMRDPRITVRNAICSNTGSEEEFSLRGHALEVTDLGPRERFVDAVADTTSWKEPHFHLFSVVIESAALVQYGNGQQTLKLWPHSTELTRPYG